MHSDSRSVGAEWLTSPRLRMPTIRLFLLITGNLRIFNSSMCRIALARSSSSRQQWICAVITSRAVATRASKLSCANPLHTTSRSVTIPTNRSFSPIGMAPTSWSRINFASSFTGVSGPTQSTPLCIASLTFMADLRCSSLRATRQMQLRLLRPRFDYTRGSSPLPLHCGAQPRFEAIANPPPGGLGRLAKEKNRGLPRSSYSIDSTKGAAAPQCESPLFLRPEYQVPVFPICFRHRLLAFASTIASGCVGLFRTASWIGGGCFLNALFLWRSIVLLIEFGFYFFIVAGHCAS